MKLALLGYPIAHSLSPKLYQEILREKLTQYDLLAIPEVKDIPALDDLAKIYDGINITSPYKRHFIHEVDFNSEIVKNLGAINVIKFGLKRPLATNTDAVAVELILQDYIKKLPRIQLILLGSGVMAKMTKLIADKLSLPFSQYSRNTHGDISRLDLSDMSDPSSTLVINSCSREFVFKGKIHPLAHFWDYNYKFELHSHIPSLVSSYQDGQAMLKLQAEAAVAFWQETPS